MPPSTAARPRLLAALTALTLATGMIDAVSILRLGHVFVANMTGNVVFLGLAAAGAATQRPLFSLVALAAFVVGARAAQPFLRAEAPRLARAAIIECAVVLLAAATLAVAGEDSAAVYAVVALLALAMGFQVAFARKIGVPGMTTVVLTRTLIAFAHGGPGTWRRLLTMGAMLAGAAIGAILTQHVGTAWALVVSGANLAAAGAIAVRT